MAGDDKVMENLNNYIEGAPVKVHIDNVVKKFNGRNGEMVALNGVTLDIHDNEFICVRRPLRLRQEHAAEHHRRPA